MNRNFLSHSWVPTLNTEPSSVYEQFIFWSKDGVIGDGTPEGRTKPEVAPTEGAVKQGLPAVMGEGGQPHSCLHLRWTKGFPPPSLSKGGSRRFPDSHPHFPPLPPGFRRRDGIFLSFLSQQEYRHLRLKYQKH